MAQKRPIRVLIIDDSATMRGLMSHALERSPDIEVVGYAGDAYGAREAIKSLDPDCVTLDIEMPRMDGLTFLERLMRLRPVPVVVVTSKTDAAEEIEVSALRLGAAHCLFKPAGMNTASLFDALPERIRDAVAKGTDLSASGRVVAEQEEFDPDKVICLGASTGGVDALVTLLRLFPRNCPPTLIVQHMPEKFIPLFAQRLNTVCPPSVAIATSGTEIRAGKVLIAPAGEHIRISRRDPSICIVEDRPAVNGFKPSVDVLFHSAAEALGPKTVAALLTGMGRDGAEGLLAIRSSGGTTFAQDEETSVVWGMPRVAFELGAVDRSLPLGKIANAVLKSCRPQSVRRAG